MPGLTPKTEVLRRAGYVYHFDREIYFNRRSRKAFSIEFIEDNTLPEIQKRIREKKTVSDWRFYFHKQPSDVDRRELEQALR